MLQKCKVEKKMFAIGYGLPTINEKALGRNGFYAEFQWQSSKKKEKEKQANGVYMEKWKLT